jgi:hypothetical protein
MTEAIVAGVHQEPPLIAQKRDLEARLLSARERRWTTVELDLGELDQRESAEWEARLSRHLLACGCREGAATVGLSLWYGLAVRRRHQAIAPVSAGRRAAAGFIVIAASAGIGRSIGIARARRRLRGEVRRLEALLALRAIPPSPGSAAPAPPPPRILDISADGGG